MIDHLSLLSLIHPQPLLRNERLASISANYLGANSTPRTGVYSTKKPGLKRLLLEVKEQCRSASDIEDSNPERFPTTLDARLLVPELGETKLMLFHRDGLEIGIQSQVSIKEIREIPSPWLPSKPAQSLVKSFHILRKTQFAVSVSDNTRVVLVGRDPQDHFFFGPGIQEKMMPGGKYTVQIVNQLGESKTDSIELPELLGMEQLDLSPYTNYRLLSKKGLLRRVQTASARIPVPPKYNHRDKTSHECPPTIRNVYTYCEHNRTQAKLSPAAESIESSSFSLPAGRYEPTRPSLPAEFCVALNLYPSRVVKAEYRGQSVNLTPKIDGTYRGCSAGPINHARELIFHPQTNTLVIRNARDVFRSSRTQDTSKPNSRHINRTRVFRFSLDNRTG